MLVLLANHIADILYSMAWIDLLLQLILDYSIILIKGSIKDQR